MVDGRGEVRGSCRVRAVPSCAHFPVKSVRPIARQLLVSDDCAVQKYYAMAAKRRNKHKQSGSTLIAYLRQEVFLLIRALVLTESLYCLASQNMIRLGCHPTQDVLH
jgi:hypothetical protein